MNSRLCRVLVSTIICLGAGSVFGQEPEAGPELKARLAKAPKAVEMFMPMRDGVELAANVYRPAGPGPFPVILLRTPYLKDNAREPLTAQKYVEAGYAWIDQDTRGKGHSKGIYKAFSTDIEDGYDTVEWIAKQPWSTGKIGIMGTSALGITSNMAAMSGAPHLMAAYVNGSLRADEKYLSGWGTEGRRHHRLDAAARRGSGGARCHQRECDGQP